MIMFYPLSCVSVKIPIPKTGPNKYVALHFEKFRVPFQVSCKDKEPTNNSCDARIKVSLIEKKAGKEDKKTLST